MAHIGNGQLQSRRGYERFFDAFSGKFAALFLSGLIFSAFFLGIIITVTAVFYFLEILNFFSFTLFVPFVFPFYGGMAAAARNAYKNKKISISKDFFKYTKLNFKQFLLHGIVIYLLVNLQYISISAYYSMTGEYPFMWGMLVISALLMIIFIIFIFYVSIMTVSFELKTGQIYKNALLMAIFEFKRNILAFFWMFAAAAVFGTAFLMIPDFIIKTVFGLLVTALFFPAYFSVIAVFNVYDAMEAMISPKSSSAEKVRESVKNTDEIMTLLESGDGEYVYYEGRMIKRTTLLKSQEDKKVNVDE